MKDGYLNICKDCKRAYQKTRPVNKEYQSIYHKTHRAKARANWRKHRDRRLEDNRQWKKANKEKVNNYNRKRRELKKGVSDYKFSITHESELKAKFNNECFNCGSGENLTLDHHIPLSRGGQLERGNVSLLCSSCNSKKHNKLPEEFYTPDQLLILNELINF